MNSLCILMCYSNALMTLIDLEIQKSMPNSKYKKCRKLVTVYCKVFKSKNKGKGDCHEEIKHFAHQRDCVKKFLYGF